MSEGLQLLNYEERERERWNCSDCTEKAERGLIKIYKFLMRVNKDGTKRFLVEPSDRMRDNQHQLKIQKIPLKNMKKEYFSLGRVKTETVCTGNLWSLYP